MALLLFYRAYIIKLLFSALFPLCEKIFHATLFKKPNEKLSAKASAGSFPVHVILDIFRFAFPSPKKKRKNVICVSPPPQVNVFPVWCHAKGKQKKSIFSTFLPLRLNLALFVSFESVS